MSDHPFAADHARRRGAPLGTSRDPGKGYYACRSLAGDLEALRKRDITGLDQEIDLLRVYIRRLVEEGEGSGGGLAGGDTLRPLCLAMATLSHLVCMEEALEAFRNGGA